MIIMPLEEAGEVTRGLMLCESQRLLQLRGQHDRAGHYDVITQRSRRFQRLPMDAISNCH